MRIDSQVTGDVSVLRVHGEIDYPDLEELENHLRAAANAKPPHVLLNLEECGGMVSSAIGVLVGWCAEIQLLEKTFRVIRPSRAVSDILDALGLTSTLVLNVDDEEEALEALR